MRANRFTLIHSNYFFRKSEGYQLYPFPSWFVVVVIIVPFLRTIIPETIGRAIAIVAPVVIARAA